MNLSRQQWVDIRQEMVRLGQLMDSIFDAEEDHDLCVTLERQTGKPLHELKRETGMRLRGLFGIEGNSHWNSLKD